MKVFFRISIIALFFSVDTFAATICMRNAKEYIELKEKLPVLFQKLPIKLGGESPGRLFDIYAAITISLQGNGIMLLTDSWQGPLGHYRNPAEVKSVCFDMVTKEMTISFVTESKEFKAFFTDDEVRLPEITLKKISSSQEKMILEKIYKKVPSKVMPVIETPSGAQKEIN